MLETEILWQQFKYGIQSHIKTVLDSIILLGLKMLQRPVTIIQLALATQGLLIILEIHRN